MSHNERFQFPSISGSVICISVAVSSVLLLLSVLCHLTPLRKSILYQAAHSPPFFSHPSSFISSHVFTLTISCIEQLPSTNICIAESRLGYGELYLSLVLTCGIQGKSLELSGSVFSMHGWKLESPPVEHRISAQNQLQNWPVQGLQRDQDSVGLTRSMQFRSQGLLRTGNAVKSLLHLSFYRYTSFLLFF